MCQKDSFFADILEWDGRTMLLRDTRMNHQYRVMLYDADGFTRLIGRKRKCVWVGTDGATLTHVQWIRNNGIGVTLRYWKEANKWFRSW